VLLLLAVVVLCALLQRRMSNHGTTAHEREELRKMRHSVRDKLMITWKSLSYSERGQDPSKLFRQFDRDNSGAMRKTAFDSLFLGALHTTT
jgi:hypothetical protein